MVMIGQYCQSFTVDDGDIRLQFYPDDFAIEWQQVGMVANYLSNYLTSGDYLKNRAAQGTANIEDMVGSIAYVANELFENAIKFNEQGAIEIAIATRGDKVIILLTNQLTVDQSTDFQSHVKNIAESDAAMMFFEKVEANADNEESSASGLGLLSMVMDYNVILGWQFDPIKHKEDIVTVRTMAQLPIS